MILCSVSGFRRYQGLNSRFGTLADALETRDLKALAEGRHDLIGEELFAIASPEAATRATAMLEVHRRYIDVHVVLVGTEDMGWAPLASVSAEDQPFDSENDFVCFRDPHLSVHAVTSGHLAVFFPEDAHAPLLGDGHLVHKCVFKVLLDGC